MITARKINTFTGLSTDTKPTNINYGTVFVETDTEKMFEYRLVSGAGEWVEVATGSVTLNNIAMGVNSDSEDLHEYDSTTISTSVINLMNKTLKKLVPTQPNKLGAATITISGVVNVARIVGTGVEQNVFTELRPTFEGTALNEKSGNDTFVCVNTSTNISIPLETQITESVAGGLDITVDIDAYNEMSKTGFYEVYNFSLTPENDTPIGLSEFIFTDNDSEQQTIEYVRISDTLPVVFMGATSFNNLQKISGVDCLTILSTLVQAVNVTGSINTHYNKDRIVEIFSDYFETKTGSQVTPIPSANAGHNETLTIQPKNNVFFHNPEIKCTGYGAIDSINSEGSKIVATVVDTISSETMRTLSGVGTFPTTFGGVFDASVDLNTNTELQTIGGFYKYPSGVYTNVDYSSITGERYFCSVAVPLVHASGIVVDFKNSINLENCTVYMKVEGVTGWLNISQPYDGVSTPENNNDFALDFSSSNGNVKRGTFGKTTRTGNLFIRIAMDENSDTEIDQNLTIEQY